MCLGADIENDRRAGTEPGRRNPREDARLTALFLWTLQGTNGESATNGSADGESEEEEMEEDDEEAVSRKKSKGFTLVFDVFAASLSHWESTCPGGKAESSGLEKESLGSFP